MDGSNNQSQIPVWSDVRIGASDSLVASAHTYFKRYGTVRNGARILTALSGGPDSIALLTVLRHLADSMSWTIEAAHVNYHLRGDEADGDESFCRRLCATWEIPLHIHHASVATTQGGNLQAWARSVRYAFFDELRRSGQFDHVAVGHTLDDRAETVAAAVIEARGTFALSGIPPRRESIIRPLFLASRADVIEFLNSHGIPFRQDSSNEKVQYRRNRIRHAVLPEWRAHNPGIDEGLARLGEQLWQQETFLFGEAERILADALISDGRRRLVFACETLGHCDAALDPFVLRLLMRRLGIDEVPTPATVNRFTRLRGGGVTGHVEQGDLRIECSKGQIVVSTGVPASSPLPIQFEAGESFDFGTRHFRSEIVESVAKPSYDDNIMALMDLDQLRQPYVMRTPRTGDRYEPYGLHGHKKVADILAERGVPSALRNEVPVLTDGAGIVWPVGYPIAERAKVTDATRAVLCVRVETA